VIKWVKDAKEGIVVAGGGEGLEYALTQVSYPRGVIVDQLGTVYVADYSNHRIMRWSKGATQGSVVVGGNRRGGQANQLHSPVGLSFDRHGNLYVADNGNHRIQKFLLEDR
jgi:sugar lactone lactonase YvrE